MLWGKKKAPVIMNVEEHAEQEVKAAPVAPVPKATEVQQQPELEAKEATEVKEATKEEEAISIEQVIIATYQKTLELERITNLLLENVLLVNTNLLNQSQTQNKPSRSKKE